MDYDTAFSNVSNLRGAVHILTEPSAKALRDKLISIGYQMQFPEQQAAFETLLKRIWERKS
jgi:hypothetical protein